MITKPYQRLTLYESPSRFYLVGSDSSEQTFNVLKIDRTDSKNLNISEDNHKYTKAELDDLLQMISNSVKKSSSKSDKFSLRTSACRGLLGFVRFLEGYYMILATKARRVCRLGFHWFYKIEETCMTYIPFEQLKTNFAVDEQRYLRIFQAVDLSTNFYFSFTYDLSRTLSSNVVDPHKVFESKYLWNNYLFEGLFSANVNRRWILPIIHGYLGSSALTMKNSPLTIILIARRSCKFAGTRFLKRGANFEGYVANDVETEQIVYDSSVSSLERGRYTSFVQFRGSVPLIWSQDLTKVVGKPPIQMDLVDPFAVIPALHFRIVRETYGSPIIVISLVKRREKRMHENILNDEFKAAISYLNQFLDPQSAILFLSFDMARCHKAENVLPKLEEIGYNVVKLTGWFQSFRPLFCHEIRKSPFLEGLKLKIVDDSRVVQTGVPRTNCVDCLDRTNVAQFVIGKVALAYQLHALAALDEPVLNWDTEICRSLESLYEEHGDTLALQYAGSQLVHSIRTYKKTAIFQERSRDVIQTLSRYYSNTFADYDKQNALNLFLGVFRPDIGNSVNLWDLSTDFWLHNSNQRPIVDDYCAWFELPDDYHGRNYISAVKVDEDELSDFDKFYRTFEISSFESLLSSSTKVAPSLESVTSSSTSAFTQPNKPFWKRPHVSLSSKSTQQKDENDTDSSEEEGVDSDVEIVYSMNWNDQSYHENTPQQQHKKFVRRKLNSSLSSVWRAVVPSTKKVYGFEIKPPNKQDMAKYETFVKLDQRRAATFDDVVAASSSRSARLTRLVEESTNEVILKPMSLFTNDSSFGVDFPEVSEHAVQKYAACIACASLGPRAPSSKDAKIYFNYAQGLKGVVCS